MSEHADLVWAPNGRLVEYRPTMEICAQKCALRALALMRVSPDLPLFEAFVSAARCTINACGRLTCRFLAFLGVHLEAMLWSLLEPFLRRLAPEFGGEARFG